MILGYKLDFNIVVKFIAKKPKIDYNKFTISYVGILWFPPENVN